MNILYIGGGFVGACSAAASADSGHTVLVYDIDKRKVDSLGSGDRDKIETCLFEDGLSDLLIRNSERITFTSDFGDVESFVDSVNVVFMCLPTPEIGETGESNLSYYYDAATKLSGALAQRNNGAQHSYVVVVNKSTVPVAMVDETEAILTKHGVTNFGVVSNPEFLVEGKAIEGSIRPDRVVIGAWKAQDFAIMREVYQRFYNATGIAYVEVNPKEAAAGKLLANFYLFSRLALCFDVIGRTAETYSDIRFENLRRVMTTDPRIGTWGFYDSLYAGGSCFIKDARSLAHQLRTAGQNAVLVDEVYLANKRQLDTFLGRSEHEAHFSWEGKRVALLGLAFKQDTNDVRNSPSIVIVQYLLERRVHAIQVYDPTATEYFKHEFPNEKQLHYAASETEAMTDVDAVIVATDWPQFRALADSVVPALAKKPLIMDGRRMWQHRYHDLQAAGFDIIAVGSPFIKGLSSTN